MSKISNNTSKIKLEHGDFKTLTPIEFDPRTSRSQRLINNFPALSYVRKLLWARKKNNFISKTPSGEWIFIHIPKAAGQSISEVFYGDQFKSPGHHSVQFFDEIFVTPTKYFAFVRSPLDRAFSAFNYLKNDTLYEGNRHWSEKHLSQFKTFNEFAEALENKDFRDTVLLKNHFRPQTEFLVNRSGFIELDFLGRFENIERDFNTLCALTGLNARLPQNNTRNNFRDNSSLSKRSKHIIKQIYQIDCKYLGYEE